MNTDKTSSSLPFSWRHRERHVVNRIGWLRAGVLGANDGIVSTASLVIGVATAGETSSSIFVAGLAGLVAGAMSMAAGEYVSVSSQADAERAELAKEQEELVTDYAAEHEELAEIYKSRGIAPSLADTVARQLMEYDALGAHARDELGLSEVMTARPLQAAFTSALSFALGAALPLMVVKWISVDILVVCTAILSLVFLGLLGAVAAWTGGAPARIAIVRVMFWGAMAMLVTASIGYLVGKAV